MARIRTIKPEFPQSESMGRVSRDARLCFIMLWTIADDAGRLRGNSRMLASLLYPYDDDAKGLMDGWLAELEKEGCITRYSVGSDSYVQVNGWQAHQKIDRPSASKIPTPAEPSRTLANPREPSSEDLRIKDQGSEDQGADLSAPAQVCKRLKQAGMQSVNPSDPRLIGLLEAGLTPDEIVAAGVEAVEKKKPFAYALAIAEGRRRDAATAPLPDKRSVTVPAPASASAALAKLEADKQITTPPPAHIRAQIAEALKGKVH